jgi:hypothetical protein
MIDIEHGESITQHSFLDFVVQRGVSGETWRLIDFQEPRSTLIVDHNIETKDLEAHGIIEVIWLTTLV